DERQIRPVLLGRSVAAESCDALYIARSDKERIEDLTATFRYSPVLTVSDAPDFALDGGVIELSTRDNRVQISINVSASKRAGLEISSQLLELAKIVDDRRAEL
ncbi:MAG: YfiR family protein, partial [Pseudomonadota bacterium]